MDLSEWQQERRESFSDVYLKVLTPVCCSELTDLTKMQGKRRIWADSVRAFSLLALTKM